MISCKMQQFYRLLCHSKWIEFHENEVNENQNHRLCTVSVNQLCMIQLPWAEIELDVFSDSETFCALLWSPEWRLNFWNVLNIKISSRNIFNVMNVCLLNRRVSYHNWPAITHENALNYDNIYNIFVYFIYWFIIIHCHQ